MCNTKIDIKSRREIIIDITNQYQVATKKEKGRILNELITTTKYNRKYLMEVLKITPEEYFARKEIEQITKVIRKKPLKYSENTIVCIKEMWFASGKTNCKSFKKQLPFLIENAKKFNWLENCVLDELTITELKNISSATIGRYLKITKKKLGIYGISTTKPGSLLRNSIEIRKAGDEVEQKPGFIEIDTVAHCGNTLRGTFLRSLTATDAFIGWTENAAIKNNAHANIEKGLNKVELQFPYPITGVDSDNGSEFINYDMINWINEHDREIYFTRTRPYMKNDNARVEQKNNVVVRKIAHYHRYDTDEEIEVLNELYSYMRLRFNFFTPTRKVFYTVDEDGNRKKHYDEPETPYSRLLRYDGFTGEPRNSLIKQYESLNIFEITQNITRLMNKLDKLASRKPESQDYGNNHKKQSARRWNNEVLK